jgi:chromosome segregation ATPase
MGDIVMKVLAERFTWGLAVGLAVAAYVWWSRRAKVRELEQKLTDMSRHLNTQMEVTAKGSSALKEELEELRRQNENLRVSLQALQSKPGRAELRTLHVYDRAIHLLNERAPGFGPAWEGALRDAETEIEEAEKGLRGLVRKVFNRPRLSASETSSAEVLGEAPEQGEE